MITPTIRQFHSHQRRDFQLKMHQNPFDGRAALGELTALPRPLAGFREQGGKSKDRSGEEGRKGREGNEAKGGKGREKREGFNTGTSFSPLALKLIID